MGVADKVTLAHAHVMSHLMSDVPPNPYYMKTSGFITEDLLVSYL
jgi:hypothetical protein